MIVWAKQMRPIPLDIRRNCSYDAVCDFQSPYTVHNEARRGRLHKHEVIEFELDLGRNLMRPRGTARANQSVQIYRAHLAHGGCWHLEQNLLSHLVLSRSTLGELEWDKAHPAGEAGSGEA